MKQITVIDNYDSFVYNLVRYLEEEGCQVDVMRNDKLRHEVLDKCDGIILSPGPGIPSEAGDLLSVINEYATRKKILGVCLGHQAIAEHFGGSVVQSENAIHGKSSILQHSKSSILFEGIPSEFEAGRYHSWHVESTPSEFYTTALTSEGENMAMEHSELPIYGVQFHPESVLTPHGRRLITNWINK